MNEIDKRVKYCNDKRLEIATDGKGKVVETKVYCKAKDIQKRR